MTDKIQLPKSNLEKKPTRKKTINVRHYCNIGDQVASLIGLKKYYELTGKKSVYCQQLNVRARYYDGAIHPVMKDGQQVMCNEAIWELMKPLIKAQEYIADAQVYNGQPLGVAEDGEVIGIDFTVIRQHIFVNIPNQAIQQWLFIAFPDIAADISKAWITVPDKVNISNCKLKYGATIKSIPPNFFKNKCIVNFTERYRNEHMEYFFLKHYETELVFSGTEKEHKLFCKQWGLKIPLLIVKDFLQLAFILKQSKFLLSNQSFLWNLAESIKHPRTLELCVGAPNCQAFVGEDSYGYLNQTGNVVYFETLMSK